MFPPALTHGHRAAVSGVQPAGGHRGDLALRRNRRPAPGWRHALATL